MPRGLSLTPMKTVRLEQPELPARHSDGAAKTTPMRTPKGKRTRSRILKAAAKVFGSRGYYAASIVDITRQAKVAQGTFYLYFPSKLDVFVELFDYLGRELHAAMHQATSVQPDRMGKERAGLGAYLEYLAKNPELFRVAREAEFVVPEKWYAWYDDFILPYVKGLETAIAKGEIRRLNPRLIALALIGIGDFVGAQLVLRRKLRSVPKGAIDDLVDFIGTGLVGQPVKSPALARTSKTKRPPTPRSR